MPNLEQLLEDGHLALAGEYSTHEEAHEHALVVLAMNLECWVRMDGERMHFGVYIEPAYAIAVQEEFEAYELEQSQEVPVHEAPVFSSGIELAFLWVMSVLVVFSSQMRDPDFTERYCSSSLGFFRDGDWWRPFTALFLHGDFDHMLGNIVFGSVFFILVAQATGPWLGWALILLSGVLGNVATSALYYPRPFESLGASTASFGALGILTGIGIITAWRSHTYIRSKALLVPLGGGLALLGWLGAGGPNTDIFAHAFGFAAGLALGLFVAFAPFSRPTFPDRRLTAD